MSLCSECFFFYLTVGGGGNILSRKIKREWINFIIKNLNSFQKPTKTANPYPKKCANTIAISNI